MPRITHRPPAYRLHKPSGQARVRVNGREIYLGPYGSPESQKAYSALLAQLAAGQDPEPPRKASPPVQPSQASPSVSTVIAAFRRHARTYYVRDGKPTGEVANFDAALRPLRRLFGETPADEFGPKRLRILQDEMVKLGWCRRIVNRQINRVRHVFKWAASEELVPASVWDALRTVRGLSRGRTEAPDYPPVRPVPEEHVIAIEPFVSRQVWAMVELQLLTGMRPGEVVIMRTGDIDRSGPVWTYRPRRHKTEHHGRERVVFLGPRAQDVLRDWLRPDPDAFLFQPVEAEAERRRNQRARRKTKVQPSQRNRRKRHTQKKPGACYTTESYNRAIATGIGKANRERERKGLPPIPRWSANQLRHTAATRIRAACGIETARCVLGHADAGVTHVYAAMDLAKAADAALRLG